MKLDIKFQNIVDQPCCAIRVNGQELYRGLVASHFFFDVAVDSGSAVLEIEHWDKQPQDTVVENGVIVRDRSFELESINLDGASIEELIWQSEFVATDGQVYPSCLFFGPNGRYVLQFHLPVLHWMLESRHRASGTDPGWEQDYNYYIKACEILQQISTK